MVLARPTKAQRQDNRRQIGSLSGLILRPATLKRYWGAVKGFLSYLKIHSQIYLRTLPQLDELMCCYIEGLWEHGESKGVGTDLCSGMVHFVPAAKRRTSGA